jgi:hypothetical protein
MKSMKKSNPNLFVPGAGKSGTSALHELLNFHPDICMSSTKEPHFWTRINFNDYTNEDFEKYYALFDTDEDVIYKGESSTGYMQFPNFIERIKSNYEDSPKFIFILRNPIDRCYSHYWWLKGLGSEQLDFRSALMHDFDIEPSHETKLPEANYKSYYQYGLYGKWLKRFYDNFKTSDIKIITSEQLKSDPLNTMNSCFAFLKLKPLTEIAEVTSNKTLILKYPFLFKYSKLFAFNQLNIPQFVKDITPSGIKVLIRKHLIKTVLKYTKSDKSYAVISDDDREFVRNLYKENVLALKELSGLEFEEWTDFNN